MLVGVEPGDARTTRKMMIIIELDSMGVAVLSVISTVIIIFSNCLMSWLEAICAVVERIIASFVGAPGRVILRSLVYHCKIGPVIECILMLRR